MNDEIKEILEQLEWYRKIGKKDVYYPECVLPNKKAFLLLDYITNLQQRIDNAIEYCDKEIRNIIANFDYIDTKDLENIRTILQGDSNE